MFIASALDQKQVFFMTLVRAVTAVPVTPACTSNSLVAPPAGVTHFEECYYVFGVPLWDQASACPWGCSNIMWSQWANWSDADAQTSRDMMQAWTNFAKTGYDVRCTSTRTKDLMPNLHICCLFVRLISAIAVLDFIYQRVSS